MLAISVPRKAQCKIDKKIDVKKLSFGSKIDGTATKRDDLFSVKRVLAPDKVELSNGLVIRLLGIKPKADRLNEGIEYLQSKLYKKRVFMKYDIIKYDSDNTLLCYLYLDNKTFVNRHLIKTGYVDLDSSIDFKYKKTFMEDLKNA